MASVTNATMTSADMNHTYVSVAEQNPTPIPDDEMTRKPSLSSAAPKPNTPVKTTESKTRLRDKMTTAEPSRGGGDSVGIIILVVIIIIAILAGIVCYVARSRARRYSVDFTSRPDEAHIPLSTVEADAVPHNGLQFEGTEPHEPEEQSEEHMVLNAEPENVVDVGAPSADSSEDQPQQEVPEPGPPAPVETSAGEKTDDDGAAANKTSVE